MEMSEDIFHDQARMVGGNGLFQRAIVVGSWWVEVRHAVEHLQCMRQSPPPPTIVKNCLAPNANIEKSERESF